MIYRTDLGKRECFNIEIKARCRNPNLIRKILKRKRAEFIGVDHQIDTYFKLPPKGGKLKLREGDIEKELIFYKRENRKGPKKSEAILVNNPGNGTKELLANLLGITAVVDKRREIFCIKNVRFHIDQVSELGEFVEIEASNKPRNNGNSKNGTLKKEILLKQVNEYMRLFEMKGEDLVSKSYSDMLIEGTRRTSSQKHPAGIAETRAGNGEPKGNMRWKKTARHGVQTARTAIVY